MISRPRVLLIAVAIALAIAALVIPLVHRRFPLQPDAQPDPAKVIRSDPEKVEQEYLKTLQKTRQMTTNNKDLLDGKKPPELPKN